MAETFRFTQPYMPRGTKNAMMQLNVNLDETCGIQVPITGSQNAFNTTYSGLARWKVSMTEQSRDAMENKCLSTLKKGKKTKLQRAPRVSVIQLKSSYSI